MRGVPGEMVRQIGQDGLSGDYDVPTVPADPWVDGKGYRAVAQRSLHLAELVQRIRGAPAWPYKSESFYEPTVVNG